jgi:hypothetical protein
MKRRTVTKTSVFPASKEVVFSRLKELKTLQYVAAPLATFSPINGVENMVWQKNEDFVFRFKLFGFLPFGIHTIHVVELDETSYEIYTNETNIQVPIWNHRIILKVTEAGETEYTDAVEIYAGWKTPFIYLWAKGFYAHRQRKWVRLLKAGPKIARIL